MPKIFISYRRADATDAAGRIFDRLVAVFGEQHVFKDVDSIPLGSDFGQVIAERLADCDVVIVVIGRFWLNVKSRDGTPRLENPGDYVRIEIEQALNSRALVVPALVGNVAMPREEQLPESMRQLTRRSALSVRPDPDFHRDMDRLIRALQDHEKRKNPSPPEPPKPRPRPTANAWGVVAPVHRDVPTPRPARKSEIKTDAPVPRRRLLPLPSLIVAYLVLSGVVLSGVLLQETYAQYQTYGQHRFKLYGLWLPIPPAAFLAYALSQKGAFSITRAFFQCWLITIAIGAAGGALLDLLEETGSGYWEIPYWYRLGIWQAFACSLVGVINASVCVATKPTRKFSTVSSPSHSTQ